MNNFLQTRQQIDDSTKYLQDNGFVESGISAKNWEISQIIEHMQDGNWIDLGSDGSVVIPNLLNKNIKGAKVGIDLAYKESYSENGVDYISGDLCEVPFPDGFFNFACCLSVIEHQVDIGRFAKECSRLLSTGGKLWVSCDYWTPKVDTAQTKLYSLNWNVLDQNDVINLQYRFAENKLAMTSAIDWTLKDAVINDQYCSPVKNVSYSFGIFEFIKK